MKADMYEIDNRRDNAGLFLIIIINGIQTVCIGEIHSDSIE